MHKYPEIIRLSRIQCTDTICILRKYGENIHNVEPGSFKWISWWSDHSDFSATSAWFLLDLPCLGKPTVQILIFTSVIDYHKPIRNIYTCCVWGPLIATNHRLRGIVCGQPLHATRLQWLGWVCVAPHALPQHHSWLCGTTSVVKYLRCSTISSCSLVLKSGRCSWASCDRLRC